MGECLISKYPDYFAGFKIIDLGEGQTFNIGQYYKRYSSLTADNFFALSATQATGSDSVRMNPGDDREWHGFKATLDKSYNASTGILTFRNTVMYATGNTSWAVRGTANVHAVLVTELDKLVNLGNINGSYNVSSSYSNYADFTGDNFLIQKSGAPAFTNSYYAQSYQYDDSGTGKSTISKTYNASTGVLNPCRIRLASNDTSGVYTYFDYQGDSYLTIFLIPNKLT